MKTISKTFVAFLLLIVFIFSAQAQKVSNVQKGSVRAPKNVKVDGKATEWDDKLQAYNHATQVSYAIANDDKKLYLIVTTDKRNIIGKIINGGLSFTVKKDGKKDVAGGPTITYPVFAFKEHPAINFEAMDEVSTSDKDAGKKKDSILAASNASLEEKAKYIRVNGVKDVDTLISVYNTDGIKARSAFDNKMNYVLEMAVDLKVFGLSITDIKAFDYNIMLNGVQFDFVPGINIKRNETGTVMSIDINSKVSKKYEGMTSATDCWGTYILTK